VLRGEVEHLIERGRRLALEGRTVPASGIHHLQVFPAPGRSRAARIGGAVERVVVQQPEHAVGTEFHIALKRAKTGLEADFKRGQSVLGRGIAPAAVSEPAQVKWNSNRHDGERR